MKVCDFLGQPLAAGDFVTYPGTGNRGAEYGMILHRILKFSDKGIHTERLNVNYIWYSPEGDRLNQALVKVKRSKSTIKKPSTLVRVEPPARMVEVFENPDDHAELVGAWLHGQKMINWKTLKVGARYDGKKYD